MVYLGANLIQLLSGTQGAVVPRSWGAPDKLHAISPIVVRVIGGDLDGKAVRVDVLNMTALRDGMIEGPCLAFK